MTARPTCRRGVCANQAVVAPCTRPCLTPLRQATTRSRGSSCRPLPMHLAHIRLHQAAVLPCGLRSAQPASSFLQDDDPGGAQTFRRGTLSFPSLVLLPFTSDFTSALSASTLVHIAPLDLSLARVDHPGRMEVTSAYYRLLRLKTRCDSPRVSRSWQHLASPPQLAPPGRLVPSMLHWPRTRVAQKSQPVKAPTRPVKFSDLLLLRTLGDAQLAVPRISPHLRTTLQPSMQSPR